MEIKKNRISFVPYTKERAHEFYSTYIYDPAMWTETYSYDKEDVDIFYNKKVLDPSRRFFGISINDKTIGEIQLKYIDFEQGCGTLSIHLSNDNVKNHGYGTESVKLMIEYGFYELGLKVIYADFVHRNKRSQHILEKLGFQYTHEDDSQRYYKLERM